jgi:hypothetical protein
MHRTAVVDDRPIAANSGTAAAVAPVSRWPARKRANSPPASRSVTRWWSCDAVPLPCPRTITVAVSAVPLVRGLSQGNGAMTPAVWCPVHFNARAVSQHVLECSACKRLGPPRVQRIYALPLGLALRMQSVAMRKTCGTCHHCIFTSQTARVCSHPVYLGSGRLDPSSGPDVSKIDISRCRHPDCPGWKDRYHR